MTEPYPKGTICDWTSTDNKLISRVKVLSHRKIRNKKLAEAFGPYDYYVEDLDGYGARWTDSCFLKPIGAQVETRPDGMIDIRGGHVEVEADGKGTLWVNVDGFCRLRVQNAASISMTRPGPKGVRERIFTSEAINLRSRSKNG